MHSAGAAGPVNAVAAASVLDAVTVVRRRLAADTLPFLTVYFYQPVRHGYNGGTIRLNGPGEACLIPGLTPIYLITL